MCGEVGERSWIDAAADRFEGAWNAGQRPRIEDFLAGAPEPMRPKLLGELLQVERQLRGAAGESLTERECRARFPEHAAVIDAAFRTPPAIPASSNPTSAAGTRIGRYKLLKEIGVGGMGTVWLAGQTRPVRRKVALKLINPGMDSSQILARFQTEQQALALMDHPNIAKVLDGGLTRTGRPYFVMEYVKGVPINEYCDATRLSVRERLELFVPICQAVHHAHQKGIIHRDLKPSNVLVAPYDGTPVPKVIDFGLAKALHRPLADHSLVTDLGAVVGTPEYMSPEQATLNNLDIDTRSDVYALGVLLYVLLTGTTPVDRRSFGRAAVLEVLRVVREVEPPRPSVRLSSTDRLPSLAACRQTEPARLMKLVKGDLDWIVMKAIEKERARRYESASELARDVGRFLRGDPVEAGPPSMLYRAGKFARKHRAALGIAAGVFLLLASAALVSTALMFRARDAESATKEALARVQEEQEKTNAALVAERKAGADAERQGARAEDRERLAIEAVKRFRDAVQANPDLKKRPELDALRKALLKEPLEFFRRLRDQLQADHGTRLDVLAKLAGANIELARTTAEVGSYPDASRSLLEAIDILEPLVRDHPDAPQYRDELARALGVQGVLSELMGDPQGALKALQRSLEIREGLVRDYPSVNEYQFDLALLRDAIRVATGRPNESGQGPVPSGPTTELQPRDAVALQVDAGLLQKQGRVAEAIALSQRAVEICERLARADPTNPERRIHLAAAHRTKGSLQRVAGQQAEAIASFRRSAAICEPLARDNRAVIIYQFTLATCLGDLGQLLHDTGRHTDASVALRRAVEISERLAGDNVAVIMFQRQLAATHATLGSALWFTRDYQGSAEAHRRAIETFSRLSTAHPNDLAFRDNVAVNQSNLGNSLRDLGDLPRAVESYRQAIATGRALVDASPNAPEYHRTLGRALNNLGAVLQDSLGRHDEAVLSLKEAIDQQRIAFDWEPHIRINLIFLGESHLRLARSLRSLRRAGEAMQVTQARRALWQGNPDELYSVACDMALCVPIVEDPAQRQAIAAEAVHTLGQAIAAGWKNAQHTNRDPDLTPLREREDFRKLLDELFDETFPADPLAR